MSAFVVGLTGGIGSGKTAVTNAFAKFGIDIIDADVIAREVVAPGSDGLAAIAAHFGSQVLHDDGTLNRQAMREHVFQHPDDKQWLNNLLHPMIREGMNDAVQRANSAYCILAIPLLVENQLQHMADRVVVVDCPESLQLSRAMARDGSDKTTIENIMASQASRQDRLAIADDVIDNSGTLEATTTQIKQLHLNYCRLSGVS
ncbi:dephospho-CoA kinase [Alteromonas halophila]|uniref:Dephospho-CoA kinase n=1 Tax=Alteromonas halophila TaxID=516698 RepID=A0A918JPU6_9ALTE|nr:dephospho-CoA kinase [Alteromonas halophila]GGW94055.1 dephospho-CoA kinase [Alteromonas halophila]